MLEVERNPPVEPGLLSEFLGRCGWEDPEAAAKLWWVLVASEHWVVCRLDGEMIGFGRSARSRETRQAVLSVMVDPRFDETSLKGALAYLLVERAAQLVWVPRHAAPDAPPDAYLGKWRARLLASR